MSPRNRKLTGPRRVYFVRRADGEGPIKIGCSASPIHRLRSFVDWCPYKLEIVATAPGTFADENALHRYFAGERLHGEWFNPCPDLVALVESVRANGELLDVDLDARTAEMRRRYLDGETLQQIGDSYELTRERVRQLLRRADVPSLGYRPQHNRKPTCPASQKVDEIAALARAGKTTAEIAEIVGDNLSNVASYRRKAGITLEPGRRRTQATLDKADRAVALYRAGYKAREIAEAIGTHPPSIYRLLRIRGVVPCRADRTRYHASGPNPLKSLTKLEWIS